MQKAFNIKQRNANSVIGGVTLIKSKTTAIKNFRIKLGYSQKDVALGVCLNTASYCQIENGRCSLRPKTARKIADFLQKSFDDIFVIVDEDQKGA